jgi:vacuolar-type H+-ATPase subunit D/Vma8
VWFKTLVGGHQDLQQKRDDLMHELVEVENIQKDKVTFENE